MKVNPFVCGLIAVLIALAFTTCKEPTVEVSQTESCNHVWDWVETKPPTATEAGEETYTCLICGQTGIKRPKPAIQTVITSVTISITAPVNGGTPNTAATTNDTGYTLGAVTWLPADSKFLGGTAYTASLMLTANSGYTFSGLNSATVNGQGATISNSTGSTVTLSYVFSATDTKTVTGIAIKTQPAKLTYTHGDSLDLTGLVVTMTHDDTTTEDVSAADFASKNITATPAQSDSLVYSTHNGQPVTITYGNLTPQSTNNLTVNPKTIANVEISVTAPVKNSAPDATANGTGDFTIGAVTWSPADSLFLGGTVYAVSFTLTADSGYTFTGLSSATINGQSATVSNNNGSAVTLSYIFPATDTKTVTSMAIKTQPTKLTYTHGDPLDLTGLVVTLTHDDTTAEDVSAANFASKNITANPANSNHLVRSTHNGQPVTITYGELTQSTNNLTVNRANGATVSAPTGSSVNGTSITINPVTAPGNGQTVEYARNTSNSAPSSGWQSSTTFSGLTAGTYYFFARSAQNDNYNAGTASASIQVTTSVTVTFNANGATGTVPAAQTADYNTNITLPPQGNLARAYCTFGGWNTNADGTGTNYSANSSYTVTGSITLYAKWIEAIPLTVNQWADGNIPTSSDVQWFSFTATASTQYIHASFGTLTRLNVNVYDSSDAEVEGETSLSGVTTNISRTLTSGQTYYIRVRPYSSSYSGTYRIAFNASSIPPGITPIHLTANQWADSNLSSYGQQWFTFTATASTQYIHFEPGTLIQVGVRVYDSSGTQVGNATNLSGTTTRITRTLTSGQMYYIRIMAYTSGNSGTYKIGFTASTSTPFLTSTPIPLTANQWADGNIPTAGGEQWFVFTATASRQYIHFDPTGTLKDVYVQVYDNSGTEVGSQTNLYSFNRYTSISLTSGQTYYIRVTPSSSSRSGTYRIAFNASGIPPGITPIPLTFNTWADGNLPTSNDEQWFTFTATASTQYIHFKDGTLTQVSVEVYDDSGLVSSRGLSGSTTNTSQTLTSGQTYYIRVRPSSSSRSGTYQIGFTASTSVPLFPLPSPPIPLTFNTWADGNLPTSGDVQWFSFTATASTQYIHADLDTLSSSLGVYVQVYDSGRTAVGIQTNLSGSTRYTSESLTSGQTYYIRVWPRYSTVSGTYRIGFTTSIVPPGAIPLTVNIWADGNIPKVGGEQWFTFTATDSWQYIHLSNTGTLTDVYVQVYDNSGTTVGSVNLYGPGANSRTSLSLTSGQTYYIRVRPYINTSSGTYQIGFNASTSAPFLASTPIPLTANQWADGNIPTSGGQEWFTFTATASTQYIHFSTSGALKDVYVQVYASNGATSGSETNLHSSTTSTSRTLTSGQTYYIRVRPYGSGTGGISGTYRIGFNTLTTAPTQ